MLLENIQGDEEESMKYMLRLLIFLHLFIITIAYKSLILNPGGLKGYYMLGISQYIKQHYDLSNWHYYGSSAGAVSYTHLTLPTICSV